MTCSRCVFFEGSSCHRNPPVIVPVAPKQMEWGRESQSLEVMFPWVSEEDWCGEFKLKKDY